MKSKHCFLVLFILLITACSDPLPANKLSYAGDWRSAEMKLLILEDGTVAYKRLQGGGSTSVNGPLKEFQGDSFLVGLGPFTTTFEVTKPPHEVDGRWQMVVDGVLLVRLPPGNR